MKEMKEIERNRGPRTLYKLKEMKENERNTKK